MEEIVKGICELRGVPFKKETSSWFNGHGCFPHHTYEIDYNHEGWEIKVLSEWRVSEFVRSNANAFDPFSSPYLWSITASANRLRNSYSFTIERESWIKRMTRKNRVSIKSNSVALDERLKEIRQFEVWFVTSDYPIRNVFSCESAKGKSKVFTSFSTGFNPQEKINGALELVELVCVTINEIENYTPQ